MARIWYATLEDIARAADIGENTLAYRRIANALDEGSDAVESLLKRVFYPTTETRYFPWPQDDYQSPRVLYLDGNELASVTQVITQVGDTDTVIDPSYLHLGPADLGPPYTEITLADGANALFERGSDPRRSIAVTGIYIGGPIKERQVATTTTDLTTGSTVTVSNATDIGTGSLIRLGTERLIVTARSWANTGNVEPVTLAKDLAAVSFTVTDGALFHVGEHLLIDAEQLEVTGIADDLLIVKRAANGTVLAAHTAVFDLYAPRTLTVDRAQLGSSQATATTGATVWLFEYPGLVSGLCRAETLVTSEQLRSAYARVAGGGETATEATGRGLADIRTRARMRWGRRARIFGSSVAR